MLHQSNPPVDDQYAEMMQDYMEMKQVSKIFNTVFLVYAATCITYALGSLFLIVVLPYEDFLFMFADGILTKFLVFGLAFLSCYKHQNFYVILAILMQTGMSTAGIINASDTIFSELTTDISLLSLIVFVILSAFVIIANRRYKYLENRPGFPYFNQNFEEQKKERLRNQARDPFMARKKQLQRNSSTFMFWIDKKSRSTDTGSEDKNSKCDMDEI